MAAYSNIQVSHEENGAVGIITFCRPQVLNALNSQTVSETLDAVQAVADNHDVRVLIFTGEGRAFVAGADIQEMIDKSPAEARAYSELGHTLFNTIQDLDAAVIAAVNGYALGGGAEVALSCDIRIAADTAVFGLPETMLGVLPGWGGTQRAARLVGPALAKELILTGERVNARRALEMGLVNRVVPPEELMPAAMDMARKICNNGRLAVIQAKRLISRGLEMPLRDALRLEADAFAALFETRDQKEGMRAFLEKRPPRFTGC